MDQYHHSYNTRCEGNILYLIHNYPIHNLVLVLFKLTPNNYISMKFYDKMAKHS